jgi:hypothetical protein
MPRNRRSSHEVTCAQLKELERLEKEKDKLEKDLEKNANKPAHWAIVKGIAEVGLMIASIVKAIKRRNKKRRK